MDAKTVHRNRLQRIRRWFDNPDHVWDLLQLDPHADRLAIQNAAARACDIPCGDPEWATIGGYVDDFFASTPDWATAGTPGSIWAEDPA